MCRRRSGQILSPGTISTRAGSSRSRVLPEDRENFPVAHGERPIVDVVNAMAGGDPEGMKDTGVQVGRGGGLAVGERSARVGGAVEEAFAHARLRWLPQESLNSIVRPFLWYAFHSAATESSVVLLLPARRSCTTTVSVSPTSVTSWLCPIASVGLTSFGTIAWPVVWMRQNVVAPSASMVVVVFFQVGGGKPWNSTTSDFCVTF